MHDLDYELLGYLLSVNSKVSNHCMPIIKLSTRPHCSQVLEVLRVVLNPSLTFLHRLRAFGRSAKTFLSALSLALAIDSLPACYLPHGFVQMHYKEVLLPNVCLFEHRSVIFLQGFTILHAQS